MRKRNCICLMLMFIICSVLFAACSSETGVPDKYIDYAVQDLLNSNYLMPEKGYESYKVSTDHNMNNSSHTDDVNVTVYVIYPNGEVVFQGNQTYQYLRSNDTWSEMNYWDWDKVSTSINSKAITKTWTGRFYELDIESVNFDNGTIKCKYSITDTQGTPWTKGGITQITYTGQGTFDLEKEYGGTYRFYIHETDESYYIDLSAEKGVYLGYWG